MKTEEFFPRIEIVKDSLVLNTEAIETMELDTPSAKVVLIENSFPDKPKSPKEILIVKTNGSLCDDIDNIKDVFPVDHIRSVELTLEDGAIVYGTIKIEKGTIDAIIGTMGDISEFKLLACNTESALAKEFKDQFGINNTYYKLAAVNDKRTSIGKEKNVKSVTEERLSV